MRYVILIADDQIAFRDMQKVLRTPTPKTPGAIFDRWNEAAKNHSHMGPPSNFVELLIWTLSLDSRILPLHTAMISAEEVTPTHDPQQLRRLLANIKATRGSELGQELERLRERWEGYPFAAALLDIAWESNEVPEEIRQIVNSRDGEEAADRMRQYTDKFSGDISNGLQWLARARPDFPVLVATQHDSAQSRRLITACESVFGESAAFAFRKQDIAYNSEKMLRQLIGSCLVACRRHAAGLRPRPAPLPSMLELEHGAVESICGKALADVLIVSADDEEFVLALLEEFFPSVVTNWETVRGDDDLRRIDLTKTPEAVVFFPADALELLSHDRLTEFLRRAAALNRFTPFAKRVHLVFHQRRQLNLAWPAQQRLPTTLQRSMAELDFTALPEIEWISLDLDSERMQEVLDALIEVKWAPNYYRQLFWPDQRILPRDVRARLSVGPKVLDCVSLDGVQVLKDHLFAYLQEEPLGTFEEWIPSTLSALLIEWAEGNEAPIRRRALGQLPRLLLDCFEAVSQAHSAAERSTAALKAVARSGVKSERDATARLEGWREREYDKHVGGMLPSLAPLALLKPDRRFLVWAPWGKTSDAASEVKEALGNFDHPNDSLPSKAARILLEFYAIYYQSDQSFDWGRMWGALKQTSKGQGKPQLKTYTLKELVAIRKEWPDPTKEVDYQNRTYIKGYLSVGRRDLGDQRARKAGLKKRANPNKAVDAITLISGTSILWQEVEDLMRLPQSSVNHSPLLIPLLFYKASDARTDAQKLVYVYLAWLLNPFCARAAADLLDLLDSMGATGIYTAVLEETLKYYNEGRMWFTCEEDFLRLGLPHFLRHLANHPDRTMRHPAEVNFSEILASLYAEVPEIRRVINRVQKNLKKKDAVSASEIPYEAIFASIRSYKDVRTPKSTRETKRVPAAAAALLESTRKRSS